MISDKYNPRVITLDPWPQLIYLEATGQRTIKELVYYLAGKYSSPVPLELDKQVLTEIDTLLKERVIELRPAKTDLPDNIRNPMS